MSRILYICHDNPKPSGGIRILYRHVNELVKAGFDAAIVHHEQGFSLNWFSGNVPVIYSSSPLDIKKDDWVVIPEDYFQAMEAFRGINCHKAVFCQNHYYIFNALNPDKSWQDYGISNVIVSSIEIKKFVKNVFNIDAAYIPVAVNHNTFKPGPVPRKPSIAFMPRKGSWNIQQIMGILWHRSPETRSIPWLPIDNMSESEVAGTMQKSALFLSTGFREGFGLPPVEAMACGCIIIGFTAGGGREYANDENGFWVRDEDPLACADVLQEVLGMYAKGPENSRWNLLREEGYKTAQNYTLERQRNHLLKYWGDKCIGP